LLEHQPEQFGVDPSSDDPPAESERLDSSSTNVANRWLQSSVSDRQDDLRTDHEQSSTSASYRFTRQSVVAQLSAMNRPTRNGLPRQSFSVQPSAQAMLLDQKTVPFPVEPGVGRSIDGQVEFCFEPFPNRTTHSIFNW